MILDWTYGSSCSSCNDHTSTKNIQMYLISLYLEWVSLLMVPMNGGSRTSNRHIQTKNSYFPSDSNLFLCFSFPGDSLVTWYTESSHCYGDNWASVCWCPAGVILSAHLCVRLSDVSLWRPCWSKINLAMSHLCKHYKAGEKKNSKHLLTIILMAKWNDFCICKPEIHTYKYT